MVELRACLGTEEKTDSPKCAGVCVCVKEKSVFSLGSVNATKSLETEIPIIKTINSGEPARGGAPC